MGRREPLGRVGLIDWCAEDSAEGAGAVAGHHLGYSERREGGRGGEWRTRQTDADQCIYVNSEHAKADRLNA